MSRHARLRRAELRQYLESVLKLGTFRLLPTSRWRAGLHLLLTVAVLALFASTRELESQIRAADPLVPTLGYSDVLAGIPAPGEPPVAISDDDVPVPFSLRRGQNLAELLRGFGLGPREAHFAVVALGEHLDLRRVRSGESGVAWLDPEGRLVRLRLDLRGRGHVRLEGAGEVWTSAFSEAVRTVREHAVHGHLEGGFLMHAIADAGGDPAVAYAMSNVLQWDLDFNRDLRRGDRFAVLYEEVRLDGEPAGPGDVLALAYTNRDELYEAFRWGEDGAYYDAEGQPRRKMFLRSPLPFSRVTSRFSHKRFHPILKVHRPHFGVDYGAPVGTPVRVTAHGTVTFKGWTKGGGHTVKVRHANGYLTAYLHLSRYAGGLSRGQRVRQEEVIGYVGATGLATAAHLDYRVQKNGRWIDPLKLPNTPAEPIPTTELAAFHAHRDALRERLDEAPARPPTALAAD